MCLDKKIDGKLTKNGILAESEYYINIVEK